MVVLDAKQDDHFIDMPVVTGAPFYRFYAGAPLKTPNGYNLGTLCILDRMSHPEFSAEAKVRFADLAGGVVNELELRLAATEDTQKQLKRRALILEDVTKVVHHQRTELLRLNRLKDEFSPKCLMNLEHPYRPS